MTTFNMTCAAVRVTLPDYIDETLEPWVRGSIEEHLAECAECAALARDLRNNAREAAALPALLPEHDVWPGVARRIGVPVVAAEAAAESAPSVAIIEPEVQAIDVFIPIDEPVVVDEPVVASAPPVPAPEPATVVEPVPLPAKAAPAASRVYEFPRREKRRIPGRMGLAAAALVLVTAGSTFLLTRQWLGPTRTHNVATATETRNEKPPAQREVRGQSAGRARVAAGSATPTSPPAPGSAVMVSATAPQVARSPEDVVYNKEINTLSRIVRRQRGGLDASTVAVIEKNLRAVDAAIAQIRAALQEDPGNSLLDGQASRALEMKVELLRRAAMLRSST